MKTPSSLHPSRSRLLVGSLLLAGSVAAQAQLFNPSFEEPVHPNNSYIGSWKGFWSDASSFAGNSGDLPRSGAASLILSNSGQADSFAGAFQEVQGLQAGVEYNLSGWHATTVANTGVAFEIRIEWRDSVSDTEVSRTPSLTPTVFGEYTPFSLTSEAPAGADAARIVLVIQSFVPGDTHFGSFHVDDVAFAAVPEPGTYAMLAAAGLVGFAVLRRRK